MVLDLGPLIGAIDQGTSSSRFLVFAANSGELITYHQVEIRNICVEEEWVEQDPNEIINSVVETIEKAVEKLHLLGIDVNSIKAIGLCNQRETTVVWDRETGKALHNAIVWLDNRTKSIVDSILDRIPDRNINIFKYKTGLPISTYFSALKLKWLFENVEIVERKCKEGKLMFGTVDSWVLWNLTKNHLIDVSNASRTFLMDIESLQWDEELCDFFQVPMSILPKIVPSSGEFGVIQEGALHGIPITGVIGDQSAALIGQHCLNVGQTKATYGTGCFIMQNIGSGSVKTLLKGLSNEAINSLITTIAFKLGEKPAVYALEGSIAIAGAAVTWMRDNLELVKSYDQVESLAKQVPDAGGVYFVPAFQGLYAPYWDPNASALFIGLSQFTHKSHLMRATLESTAYETADILSLMRASEAGIKVDGGMSCNDLFCQILADINGVDVIRPLMIEATALGAAMLAGYAIGIWDLESKAMHSSELEKHEEAKNGFNEFPRMPLIIDDILKDDLISLSNSKQPEPPKEADIFKPSISEQKREEMIARWKLAVKRSMRWTKI
ncbi:glycerol kinase 3-like protein [Dinothrombium tinctorium]|uniref:Probable glycerol kinase n=1 Tax=Dinothrombium tinctorium TaxID=1965070 RepID=A0A3S3P8P2_9ACAR|nr:glycerol kinase 3-like protein [Dinothrombium tinctorium]